MAKNLEFGSDELGQRMYTEVAQRVRTLKLMERGSSNKKFAQTNQEFRNACTKASQALCEGRHTCVERECDDCITLSGKAQILPSMRQASKFRMKKGAAYRALKG